MMYDCTVLCCACLSSRSACLADLPTQRRWRRAGRRMQSPSQCTAVRPPPPPISTHPLTHPRAGAKASSDAAARQQLEKLVEVLVSGKCLLLSPPVWPRAAPSPRLHPSLLQSAARQFASSPAPCTLCPSPPRLHLSSVPSTPTPLCSPAAQLTLSPPPPPPCTAPSRAVPVVRGLHRLGSPQVPAAVPRPHRAGGWVAAKHRPSLSCRPPRRGSLPATAAARHSRRRQAGQLAPAWPTAGSSTVPFFPCSWSSPSQRTPRPPQAPSSGRRPSGENALL